MNTTNTKRWSVVRRTTGTKVRAFASRDAAREYKRTRAGNFAIWDNIRAKVVR